MSETAFTRSGNVKKIRHKIVATGPFRRKSRRYTKRQRRSGMAEALNVARHFIKLAASEEQPEYLCHLRLQKLVYYAQGWSLALRSKPLFGERIEAWAYGPVVRDLYSRFSDYGDKPIPPEEIEQPEDLLPDEQEFIAQVWNAYKGYSAISLSNMTHNEAPWKEARGDLGPADRCAAEITPKSMRRFFAPRSE
jgi:uncharacterized phage-associated protein